MTRPWSLSLSKITRPAVSGILQRERLFQLLDEARNGPVTWLCAPAGSGKTTLAASWLDSRAGMKPAPTIWYQVDEGDGDLATFFYYLGLAAKKAAPKHKKSLPLLTPEYLLGIPAFTRCYFEDLYSRLSHPPFIPPWQGGKEGDGGSYHHRQLPGRPRYGLS